MRWSYIYDLAKSKVWKYKKKIEFDIIERKAKRARIWLCGWGWLWQCLRALKYINYTCKYTGGRAERRSNWKISRYAPGRPQSSHGIPSFASTRFPIRTARTQMYIYIRYIYFLSLPHPLKPPMLNNLVLYATIRIYFSSFILFILLAKKFAKQ